MSKTPKSLRGRGMMYAQQTKYSPYKDIDSLYSAIETKLKPKKFAVILHDKDYDDKGHSEETHFQAMLEFKNARYLKNIAKLLGEKEQSIEIWDDKIANGFSYLVHRTKNAHGKYPYDPSEVKANFDYQAELAKISSQVAKSKPREKITDLLDELYDGTIKKEDVERRITGSQYGKNCKQIEDIEAKCLQRQAEEFRKNMIVLEKPLCVIWIYGTSGTGKTSLAKKIAEKENRPYYISGSTRDIFQAYKGEHTIILDEFRPGILTYSDLLKITDPYGISVMAPSRYHDKYLACDLIIFTSPYSPYEFYEKSFSRRRGSFYDYIEDNVDKFEQLKRRISLPLYMDETHIYLTEYDELKKSYELNLNAMRVNPFSTSARQKQSAIDAFNLFNTLFN